MAPQNLRLLLITLCLTIFIASVRSRHLPAVQLESKNGVSHPARLLTGAVNPDLKKICDKTDHPILCLTKIGPFVKGKPTMESVLDASFKAGAQIAKEALAQVKAAAKKSPAGSILADCRDMYEEALENFGKSAAAKSAKDVGTLVTDLSAIFTTLETCEDEFSEAGQKSPFTGLKDKVAQITSNSLAVAETLYKVDYIN